MLVRPGFLLAIARSSIIIHERCLRRATPTLDFKDCRYNISDRTCIELINIVISKSALRRTNFPRATFKFASDN
ncbi:MULTISPECIES: hypothetical protein [unclassified Nostoc]|uniref:hypothetical protein n=1 Tax=unclassified Nostoc TaxID=2593658 RepID=UPI001D3A4D02|nr:hypothetical protein [Nostoc sp. JL23]MBN3879683.1 hypothetical protein [Nostoc sp. JL23]